MGDDWARPLFVDVSSDSAPRRACDVSSATIHGIVVVRPPARESLICVSSLCHQPSDTERDRKRRAIHRYLFTSVYMCIYFRLNILGSSMEFLQPGPCGPADQHHSQNKRWHAFQDRLPRCCGSDHKTCMAQRSSHFASLYGHAMVAANGTHISAINLTASFAHRYRSSASCLSSGPHDGCRMCVLDRHRHSHRCVLDRNRSSHVCCTFLTAPV